MIKGVKIVNGSAGGGCVSFLKKKLWLRVFHAVMLQDISEYLLDPFGKPVTFNRTAEDDFFIGSLFDSLKNGYKSSISFDHLRVRIECKVSLNALIFYPWIFGGKTKVKITSGNQFRIGREKTESTMKAAFLMVKPLLKNSGV